MNDPRILILFCVFFAALSLYNLYVGRRRLRALRVGGQRIPWFKQVNILTGCEYLLLALVFLLSTIARTGLVPVSVTPYLFAIYTLFLLGSVGLAFLVVRMAFTNARRQAPSSAASTPASPGAANGNLKEPAPLSEEERRRERRRRRLERRRKAAEERRRRAGRA